MESLVMHNVRFYEFQPEAIHCLAYNNKENLLALSRADGSIELWNCHSKPFKAFTLIGQKGDSVESLVWCQNRLFSAGLHGKILEYDIHLFLIKHEVFVTGGPTWCLALSPDNNILAAGTEEGIVCLFNVVEDSLMFNKTLQRQKNRILSIGWHEDSAHLVTGSINYVHLINVMTNQVLQFSVGKVSPKSEIIVWCVGLLSDMTVVTGDSRGKTCFWDGSFGTLINGIQTHQADVLTMQISKDSQTVYVAGVDPTIVQLRLVDSNAKQGNKRMWVKGVPRKIHTHDVRSLEFTVEGKLFSGGVDTCLELSYYPPKTVIKFPATPPRGYISVATESHSVLLGYKNRVELWRLGKASSTEGETRFLPVTEDRIKFAEIELRPDERLDCCAVSPKSKWIALCVKKKLRIYGVTAPQENDVGSIEKLRFKNEKVLPSSQLLWIDEERLLSATYHNILQLLTVNGEKVSVLKTIPISLGSMARIMTSSEDKSFIAVLDSMNQVTSFSIGKDDISSFRMPRSKIPVTALAIDNKHCLFVTYSDMSMTEYSIQEAICTQFGRTLINLPCNDIVKLNNVIHTVSFSEPNYIFLHTIGTIIRVARSQNSFSRSEPVDKFMRSDYGGQKENSRVSANSCDSNKTFKLIGRSNFIYHFSHISDGNMISVEKNRIVLFDSLPPTLKIKKFGAS